MALSITGITESAAAHFVAAVAHGRASMKKVTCTSKVKVLCCNYLLDRVRNHVYYRL